MKLHISAITISNLWDVIQDRQGKTFLTKIGRASCRERV